MQHEVILLTISGDDRPGVTSSITCILGKYNAIILDIGQSNLHHRLALGIMFKIDNVEHSGDMLKEILFKCTELGVQVGFTPVEDSTYSAWVSRQGKSRYVITLLGKEITAKQVSLVTQALADRNLNIDSI